MAGISFTDDEVHAAARDLGYDVEHLTPAQTAAAKRKVQQDRLTPATVPDQTPAPEPERPDHLTVTVEITHGDQLLGVSVQQVTIPERNTRA